MRAFVSSLSFFLTFAAVRGITHAIRRRKGPFHDLTMRGVHQHHAVRGIGSLLLVGYLWNAQVGIGAKHPTASRTLSAVYGAGSALTLDEFALWLNLRDVYWTREGRESIDAVVPFGALLSIAWWGGAFMRDAVKELSRVREVPGLARVAGAI